MDSMNARWRAARELATTDPRHRRDVAGFDMRSSGGEQGLSCTFFSQACYACFVTCIELC
jgi:hypothetical protein